jgi:hypothetical protein
MAKIKIHPRSWKNKIKEVLIDYGLLDTKTPLTYIALNKNGILHFFKCPSWQEEWILIQFVNEYN